MSRSKKFNEVFPKLDQGPCGEYYCRYCGAELEGRRTAWCSDLCNHKALVVCYPDNQRRAVYQRDKGVCAICGLDTKSLDKAYRKAKAAILEEIGRTPSATVVRNVEKTLRRRLDPIASRGKSGHMWEMDHIVPVVKGGAESTDYEEVMSNLRTLCIRCHRKETNLLVEELAWERAQDK